jgi:hypothetical protein
MKKYLLLAGFLLSLSRLTSAQSTTILPYSTELINNSNEPNTFAFKGILTATSTGIKSTAIRGENKALNNYGSGVWGSHAGGGSGVYGQSITGAGLIGQSQSGNALMAVSESGTALHAGSTSGAAAFFVNGTGNANEVVYIQNLGVGNGLEINSVMPYNESNALKISMLGTGAAANIVSSNMDGNGAGLIVGKKKPYAKTYTTDTNVDFEVRHPMGNTEGMSGLRILNTGPNLSNWTLYAANGSGDLLLYANGITRGSFNAGTGAYTTISDKRLKTNIRDYAGTLADVMKIEVKSYQRLNADKTEIGLMAQDVIKFFPEIVYYNSNDKGEQFYTVDYSRVGVIAIKAIQEQQKEIEQLKTEIAELKKLIEK